MWRRGSLCPGICERRSSCGAGPGVWLGAAVDGFMAAVRRAGGLRGAGPSFDAGERRRASEAVHLAGGPAAPAGLAVSGQHGSLDFAGEVVDVLSQPFRLRFAAADGWRQHIPDFLVIDRGARWLLDVRPADRIRPEDLVRFAAAREAALAAGWRYGVVAGWRPHVLTTLDTLASQRRPLADPLGTQPELLEGAARGPLPFAELVATTSYPAVARAHALHLIWHRRLHIDLARPLGDRTPVWPVQAGGNR
jgi:hypothetical protein